MTGCVFSIEEFSVYDGPGIRTTVFLKGCPLRCSWCHNPEGQSMKPQIVKSPNGCVNCGECEKYAVINNGEKVYTQASINNCPRNLLRVCGEEYTSDVLCTKLIKNANILNCGGGITFSGGEPLWQSEFLFDCLQKLKDKVHTAIQTSGYCDEKTFLKALKLCDYFLYDLKIVDEDMHKKFTGVSNERILKNFKSLVESGKDFVTRVPLIPTITDTEENIDDIAKFLKENGVDYAELLPYNKMAGGKYEMTGRVYEPCFDELTEVDTREEIFKKYGIKIKIL